MRLLWMALGGLAAYFVGKKLLQSIDDWYANNITEGSSYGKLIKEQLDSGNYKIVAGVFDESGELQAEKTWEDEELDDAVLARFKGKDEVVFDV